LKMEAQIATSETLDLLGFKTTKVLTSQFVDGEQVLLSCEVNKHNKRSVMQKRSLAITNKYIYNVDFKNTTAQLFSFLISSLAIKRKIAIESIEAITISSYYLSDQFILHIPKEYDIRFSGVGKKRENILKIICKEYREVTGKKMTFFISDKPDLQEFQTTDTDAAANICRMPKGNSILLSEEDFEAKGLVSVLKNKRNSTLLSNVQYSEEIRNKMYDPTNNLDQISMTESVVVTKTS